MEFNQLIRSELAMSILRKTINKFPIENICRICGQTKWGGGAYGAFDYCTKKTIAILEKNQKKQGAN